MLVGHFGEGPRKLGNRNTYQAREPTYIVPSEEAGASDAAGADEVDEEIDREAEEARELEEELEWKKRKQDLLNRRVRSEGRVARPSTLDRRLPLYDLKEVKRRNE